MRIYWIDQPLDGGLGMMARPRGNDWLEDEVGKLKLLEIDVVVSLLEASEERELGLRNEASLCRSHGIEFISHPIPDRGVPTQVKPFLELVAGLNGKLISGERVVVHCRMGIGRTSILCGAVLAKNEYDPERVFQFLSETRTLKVPDTSAQVAWSKELWLRQ